MWTKLIGNVTELSGSLSIAIGTVNKAIQSVDNLVEAAEHQSRVVLLASKADVEIKTQELEERIAQRKTKAKSKK